jgi:hypothetical protein
MPTRLDRFLAEISPENTLDAVAARVDAAMNSFRHQIQHVEAWQWADLERYLAMFFRHLENTALGIRQPADLPSDFYWGRCAHLLKQEYGPDGERLALRMARDGIEGGLYAVLRMLARRLAADYANNKINSLISDYWQSLSADEKVAAGQEYLDKYGHLFSSDITGKWALRIVAFLPEALREHPRLVQRARDVLW